jgi:hypothetical protein
MRATIVAGARARFPARKRRVGRGSCRRSPNARKSRLKVRLGMPRPDPDYGRATRTGAFREKRRWAGRFGPWAASPGIVGGRPCHWPAVPRARIGLCRFARRFSLIPHLAGGRSERDRQVDRLDVHRDFCEGAIARCGRERGPFSHAHSRLQTGSPGSGCEVAPDRWSASPAPRNQVFWTHWSHWTIWKLPKCRHERGAVALRFSARESRAPGDGRGPARIRGPGWWIPRLPIRCARTRRGLRDLGRR